MGGLEVAGNSSAAAVAVVAVAAAVHGGRSPGGEGVGDF